MQVRDRPEDEDAQLRISRLRIPWTQFPRDFFCGILNGEECRREYRLR